MRRNATLPLILTVALVATLWWVYHLGGERATLRQRLHASDSVVAVLRARTAAIDTVYRVDTVRLRVAVDRWREVTRWDTVTAPVPAETVKVIVATGTAALNACQQVVVTCEQRVATRDSLIAVLRQQRPLLTQQPSRLTRAKRAGTWLLVGAGLGYFVGETRR